MSPSEDINQAGYLNSINTIFTATSFYNDFWSSTTDKSATTKAYVLEGRYGSLTSTDKTAVRKVRCVRTR